MDKWEYIEEYYYPEITPLIEWLNKFGWKGWELTSIIYYEGINYYKCIFKRKIKEDDKH